jgi:hypothetical protein
VFEVSVPVFTLDARFRREFILQKGVGNLILLVSVVCPPVRLKVVVSNAEGSLLVDAGDNPFSTKCVVFSTKETPLKCDPIPGEQGIEFAEGEVRRTLGVDEEKVTFCKARLNRGHVERLKELRLEQFTDPCDLVARQSSIAIGQESVA